MIVVLGEVCGVSEEWCAREDVGVCGGCLAVWCCI
jgi:hypothetical protein